jgi:ankyrin repeat protein
MMKDELNKKLIEAIQLGEVYDVRELLQKGANPGFFNNGYTPVNCRPNFKILKLLEKHGANLNATDPDGNTFVLTWLNYGSCLDMLRDLIKSDFIHKIDFSIKNNNGNFFHRKAIDRFGSVLPDYFFTETSNGIDIMACEALCSYIRERDVKKVSMLLEKGVSPNIEIDGRYPINYAENIETVELLLMHGSDINQKDHNGDTLLMDWCINKSADEIQYLLNNGADSTLMNVDGETACNFAFRHENINAMRLFRQKMFVQISQGLLVCDEFTTPINENGIVAIEIRYRNLSFIIKCFIEAKQILFESIPKEIVMIDSITLINGNAMKIEISALIGTKITAL